MQLIQNINLSLANPGLLIFLIYLPIILLAVDKKFRKKFFKVNSLGKDVLLDAVVGVIYFIIIIYAATLIFDKLIPFVIGIIIYKAGLAITFFGYHTFFTSKPGIIKKFPYNFSRNSTYFFSFIAILGIAIATTSIVLFLLLAIQFILTHKIILKEEEYLEKEFGKAYKDYSKTVRRYI